MADWDSRFMDLARHVGAWSKDRSRQVGCVVVGSDNSVRALGFNGFPRGLDDEKEQRHQRPAKYLWTEHAERNAIYSAARNGVSGCFAGASFGVCCPWALVANTVTALGPRPRAIAAATLSALMRASRT